VSSRMVKKLNRRGASVGKERTFLMIVAQQPAQALAAPHRSLALPTVCSRKQQGVTLPLVVPLSMEMFDVFAQRPPQGALAEEITLDKHSSLTDLTQRSA
jgi:hypothetical protein